MFIVINLRISGIGLDFQDITEQLGISPIKVGKKGDIISRQKYRMPDTVLQEDSWLAEQKVDDDEELGVVLEDFVMKLQLSSDYLRSLAKEHHITVWISKYLDDVQGNIHIPATVINAVNNIGATLDCSMMLLENFCDSL